MSESLYFIAIVPPKPIQQEITTFKERIAERFGSKHALNAPPHITLHMPFKWKDKKIGKLKQVMTQLNEEVVPFEVRLKDFDFFEPRVVFVDVVANEQLDELQKKVVDSSRKELKLDNSTYKNQGFHPHVTIGFRDLKKKMFYEAKGEFEQNRYAAHFDVIEIKLLKYSAKKWSESTC